MKQPVSDPSTALFTYERIELFKDICFLFPRSDLTRMLDFCGGSRLSFASLKTKLAQLSGFRSIQIALKMLLFFIIYRLCNAYEDQTAEKQAEIVALLHA